MSSWPHSSDDGPDEYAGGPTPEAEADETELSELIEASDADGLVRYVDRLCSGRDWPGLVEVRDRCLQALERGKQLWSVAQFAEYRTALEAPGSFAGGVLVEGAGRFALGPLWEVAASTHEWEELADHIPTGPTRTLAAHERVVRGEDLTGDGRIDPAVLEIPLQVDAWEPAYPVAVYRADKADFPEPSRPRLEAVDAVEPGSSVDDETVGEALYELTRIWVEQSNGRSQSVAVEGDAAAAIAAIAPGPVRLGDLTPAEAMATMAWTGASGGAFGRRRGTPVGRLGAWWAAAAVTGLLESWPVPGDRLGEEIGELRWYGWDRGHPVTGWGFSLAVEDPRRGRAWAVEATDEV